jgi:hypothetical protein
MWFVRSSQTRTVQPTRGRVSKQSLPELEGRRRERSNPTQTLSQKRPGALNAPGRVINSRGDVRLLDEPVFAEPLLGYLIFELALHIDLGV